MINFLRKFVQFEVCCQGAGTKCEKVREGRGERQGEAEAGHSAGQHGGRADLRRERHPKQEPGAELSAHVVAHRRGLAARANGRHHQEGDAVDGGRGAKHGGGHAIDEPGADLEPDGPLRARVRESGRADERDGRRHAVHHDDDHAGQPGREPHAAGGRGGRHRAQPELAAGAVRLDQRGRGHGLARTRRAHAALGQAQTNVNTAPFSSSKSRISPFLHRINVQKAKTFFFPLR